MSWPKGTARKTAIWNKGLTKESDARVAAMAAKARTPERRCISKSNLPKDTRGKFNPNYGRKASKRTRIAMSLAAMRRPSRVGIKCTTTPKKYEQLKRARAGMRAKYPRGYWYGKKQNPTKETMMKRIEASLKSQRSKIITKPEKELERLINLSCPKEYRYTGNGQIIISGLCPDFTNINGQKKVIEMFGDYWHRHENPANRIARYQKFGYSCLVIWQHELKDKSENELVKIINDFNRRTKYNEETAGLALPLR